METMNQDNCEICWDQSLPQIVFQWAEKHPQKNAIISGNICTSYSDLKNMIERCSAYLISSGFERGDCIAINAVMKAEFVAAFLAVKNNRMVAIPINKMSSQAEAEEIINRTKAKAFLTDNPKHKDISCACSLRDACKFSGLRVQSSIKAVPGDELTEILFTSGSTGKPKGVMLSQRGIIASIRNTSCGMDMRHEDTILLPLPLNHSFGLRVLRAALANGETIILQNGFSFAKETKTNIERWNCTCMVAVDAGFAMLRQQMGNEYSAVLGGLRYIEFSAGAVPLPTREQLVKDLPNVRLHNTWGSTETGGALFLAFSDTNKKESAGTAINDIQLAIIDDEGNKLQTGKWGRLAIKSEALMIGYYMDPVISANALHDGWLWTNDLAKMDEDGYVFLNGRVDDIINVGGEKVAPAMVERIVSSISGIKECACIGGEDPKHILGQVPIVFIVGDTDITDQQIITELRRQGNPAMIPQSIIRMDKLPRNDVGKIDKAVLLNTWQKGLAYNGNAQSVEQHMSIGESLLQLICNRRSVRTFSDRHVSRENIDKLLLAARMAPSGHNMQTWQFTVIMNSADIQRIKDTTKTVAAQEKTSFYGFNNPDKLIIVSNDRRNITGLQDSSCAIENILLMAQALGLGACWLNSWIKISDKTHIRALLDSFGIPSSHIIHGMVAIGYPDKYPSTPAKKTDVIHYIE